MSNSRRPLALMWLIIASCLLFSGCTDFNKLFGLDKGSNNQQTTPASTAVTIYTFIDSMSKSLVSKSLCTSTEANTIADSANAAVNANGSASTNFETLIPVAVGGAVKGLKSFTAWTDPARIACVNAITACFVADLNGQFAATSASKAAKLNAKALSDSQAAVNAILARISQAAVSNLASTGIAAGSIGNAASGVVGTMIGSLASGGVDKELVSDAVGQITQGAVQMLISAGLSQTAALATAVQTITQGAVTAVSSIQVSGVSCSDYPNLATQIATGAATAIGSVASSATDLATLAGAVAAGAENGVVAVSVAASSSLSSAVCLSMIQGVTAGATSGAIAAASSTAASSASLIGAVTTGASAALSTNTNTPSSVTSAVIYTQVTEGAAAAAQTAVPGGMDQASLAAAIVLSTGSAIVTPAATDITNGIALGTNHPPVANAGADQAVTVSALVSLNGSASSDPDSGDTLTYLWSIASKPATSTAELSATTTATSSFTPDVAGTYLISLKVTDKHNATTEAFCTVVATASGSSATYQGVAASDRLASAEAFMAEDEWAQARDQFLILLTYYPANDSDAKGEVELGQCYWNLGAYDLAKARFTECFTDYPNAATAPWAHNELGWIDLYVYRDLVHSAAQFQLVHALGLQTIDVADSLRGLGDVACANGDYATALTDIQQARTSPYYNLRLKYDAEWDIAAVYQAKKDWTDAEAVFRSLFSDQQYVTSDSDDPPAKIVNLQFNSYLKFGSLYGAEVKYDQEVTLLLAQRDSSAITYLPWMRMRFARIASEQLLWNMDTTVANFTLAQGYITNALKTYSGSDFDSKNERDWTQLRLGQTDARLANAASSAADQATDETAAKAAFGLVISDFGSSWGTRQAGEAMDEETNLLIWPDKNYAGAVAMADKVLSSYPADCDQYPMAYAYFMVGQANRQAGWDQKNQYGYDYVADFQTAASNFAKVTTANFPTVTPSTWYFAQALWQMGDSYAGEDQDTLAISTLTPLLSSSSYADSDKANMELTIEEAYAEQARQAANGGDFTTAAAAWTNANNACTVVSTYKTDGSYVNNGDSSAQGYYQIAMLSSDIGDQMENYNSSDTTTLNLVSNGGIAAAQQVTWANYPKQYTTQWYFFWSRDYEGRCYEHLAYNKPSSPDWGYAQAVYSALISDIQAGKISTQYEPEALQRLANSDTQQANSYPWTTANQTQIIALCNNAITACNSLFSQGVIALDNGEGAAWSAGTAEWAYNMLISATMIGWDSSTAPPAVIDTYAAAAQALFSLPGFCMEADGKTLVQQGQPLAAASDGCGWTLQACASAYDNYAHAANNASAATAALGYFSKAISLFAAAGTYAGAQPNTVMDSREAQVENYLSECELNLYNGDQADAATAISKAEDLTASLITDSATLVEYPARAIRSMGYACMNDGPRLVGCGLAEFNTTSAWQASAQYWFSMVVNNTAYSAVDGGQVGRDCTSGLAQLASMTQNTSTSAVQQTSLSEKQLRRTQSLQKTPVRAHPTLVR